MTSSIDITSYIDIYSSGYKVPRPYNKNYIGGLIGINTGENAIVSKCYANSNYSYSYSEKHHDNKYDYSVDNAVETLYLGGLVGCNTAKAVLIVLNPIFGIVNFILYLLNVYFLHFEYLEAQIYVFDHNTIQHITLRHQPIIQLK